MMMLNAKVSHTTIFRVFRRLRCGGIWSLSDASAHFQPITQDADIIFSFVSSLLQALGLQRGMHEQDFGCIVLCKATLSAGPSRCGAQCKT